MNNMHRKDGGETGKVTPPFIYASNESKSVLAQDLDDCRDNEQNSQSVFWLVYDTRGKRSESAGIIVDDVWPNISLISFRRIKEW